MAYLTWTDTGMVRGADARPGLGTTRVTLPGVFGKTYPVGPTVTRLVDGVVHRRSRVHAQPWVRAMSWSRALTLSLTSVQPSEDLTRVEAETAAGTEATTAVGAGGAADTASLR